MLFFIVSYIIQYKLRRKGSVVLKSISEIKELFHTTDVKNIPELIEEFSADTRKGVQNIIASGKKNYDKYRAELERIKVISAFENKYYSQGIKYIGGIDEVGRGPLAGPVVTACVILPENCSILGINDSKKLSAKKREELYDIIMKEAVSVGIGMEDNNTIDDINILQATYKAMRKAIEQMPIKPQQLLVDAVTIPDINIPQEPIIKGDAKSISIGAASIVAKVTRDRMMAEYDKIYPQYGFGSNMGYGSKTHIEAIKNYGLCTIHRRSFTGNFV